MERCTISQTNKYTVIHMDLDTIVSFVIQNG